MSPAVASRSRLYRQLVVRNRLVTVLRVMVPVSGVLILALLLGQIYLSSLANRFGLGQIKVTSDSVSIEAPEYAGVLENGARYRVSAKGARAALNHSDSIALLDTALSVVQPSGLTMEANAAAALLDTTRQLVIIDGLAKVEDSSGTLGKFYQSVFDWSAQRLEAGGPVAVEYSDGTKLVATSMQYDSQAEVWTFQHATVTLPSTPGEQAP